jgi:peptidyl-prolyl cis-trans isomerase D
LDRNDGMLQTIHDKLKGIFAVAILVALGIVFVFWGVNFSSNISGVSKAKGIEVNGREIPVEDVRRNYQEQLSRMQAAMGDAGVPEEMRKGMQDRVLEDAVRQELIRQRTAELKFEATNAEVVATIREIPAFQVDGKFSADAYHAALSSIGMSPERFEAEQRQYAIARQLDRGIYNSAFVLPAELERQVALREERRTFGWVTVPAKSFESAVVVDEAAVRKYYEANTKRFMTDESATVDYVELDIDAFAAKADVTEPALRQYYEENKARYTTAGRRHARHILFASGTDDNAAEAKAKKAYDRAVAGEDFAALARELSEDPGSKESGGDLGNAERGDFVGPFGDAVWSMKPGEIRGPVKTEFGWHVIKLEGISPEVTKPFEEVRAEIESEYRHAQVEKAFGDAQEALDSAAFEASGELATVAEKTGLPIRHVESYTRAGSAELGGTLKVTEAVFSPEVLAGREIRTVELAPGRIVALSVKHYAPSTAKPFEAVQAEATADWRLEEAGKLAAAKAAETVAALARGGAWATTVGAWRGDGSTLEPKPVGRQDDGVPQPVRDAAFRAPPPSGGPRYGTAALPGGDTAIWALTAVDKGTLATMTAEARKQAHDDARDRSAMSDATVYITTLRKGADVDVNPKLFE